MGVLDGHPVGRLTFPVFGVYHPHARLPVSGDGHLGLRYPKAKGTVAAFNILNVTSANQMIDNKGPTSRSKLNPNFLYNILSAAHRNDLEPHTRIAFWPHHTINPPESHMVPFEYFDGFRMLRMYPKSKGAVVREIFFCNAGHTTNTTSWLNKLSLSRAETLDAAIGATKSENNSLTATGWSSCQLSSLILRGTIVPDQDITTEHIMLGMAFMEQFITMSDQDGK
ncbi:hypothetical protein CSKR_102345 [Clonorchis sinensis]|uniref:Uncharacterized protein n=1 Tax=Clonorchis sinensis TaxID=79923 RepID=A0A3R7GZM2_CLOSI|nr:hypothetical protein CSKR_102345 [Clonorchis sinensis]